MNVAVIYQTNYNYCNKLYGPPNDAKIMVDFFKKLKYNCIVISNKQKLPSNLDIIYMSGHGTIVNGEGVFLCPPKRRKRQLTPNDYYTGAELPSDALIILDSCFAGKFRDLTGKPKTINSDEPLRSVMSRSTQEFIHSGLLASTSNSYAQDIQLNGAWHGAFTLAFSILSNLIKHPLGIQEFMDNIQKILYTLDINQQTEYRLLNSECKAITVFNQLIIDVVGG